MSESRLAELTYFDPKSSIRLTAYADTIILDHTQTGNTICAIRFGGYPEVVRAMSDAIYGGATIEASVNGSTIHMESILRGYRRQLSHDGAYAVATLMANDDQQSVDTEAAQEAAEDASEAANPRRCYLFCPAGNLNRLFEELDEKTAAPLIPEFRDYVLHALIKQGDLRRLQVYSLKEQMDAWILTLLPDDRNVTEILNQGLKDGAISIPGAIPGAKDGFDGVNTVTDYLATFGVMVADRIRDQFTPLFDPAVDPLSEGVLEINRYIQQKAGYSLYDAQLAVAEATQRQLRKNSVALIVAECGTGKTKIGSTAMGAALYGARNVQHRGKYFGIVMCPSHVTRKWVREISETLPNTYAMVVRSISDLERLRHYYEQGTQSVYAVFSKERARDGYMRAPAVTWNKRLHGFCCPDCGKIIQMEVSDDGTSYLTNADQLFFLEENKKNHKCPDCGSSLWAPVNPGRKIEWVRIGEYGWVHRYGAAKHLEQTKNEVILERLRQIAAHPDDRYPTAGTCRRFPLSTYIKRKMRGCIDAFICDELHEFNNSSGQGDAMAELFRASKLFVGMTATLINGYSSGIFHLLYRVVPALMKKDGKEYRHPGAFNDEYGVVERTYEISNGAYNSNRRTTKQKTRSKQLPGVSPLVYSRFLLEYTSFLSLSDMGKDLPDYEEIPIALQMPLPVRNAYRELERTLQSFLREGGKISQKLLSPYLNLLTVYPDQPYSQKPILHPVSGQPLVEPQDLASFEDLLPKEEEVLSIVRRKVAAGERVMIYTSWVRTDSQQKLLQRLRKEGIHTALLTPNISTERREAWVEKRVKEGLQVLITNPKCVETGLDLNAFPTIIFYSMGYNLFTLRQAARRSYRINQTAPRIEVYLLYYADTMQAKAMKLMASKLAVAGIIEGTFSDEGLAAMSDVRDLTSQMARELMLGIKDNVEDIAAAFKKMAIINPERSSLPEPAKDSVPLLAAAPERGISEVQAAQKQKIYEDLLNRTIEENKKKQSKKTTVDENQLSLFDFVA